MSEILEHRLTIIKEFLGGKAWMWICNCKKCGQVCTLIIKSLSAIVVVLLLTRLPMKRGERPTVSAYIGVIILFFTNGTITPNSL